MNTKRNIPMLIALVAALFATALTTAQAAAADPYKLVTIHRSRAGYWDQKVVYAHFNGSSPIIRLANHLVWGGVKYALKEPTDPNLQFRISDGSNEDPREYNKEKPESPYSFRYTSTVVLTSTTLISAYGIEVDDTGGHPEGAGIFEYNIGYKNGKPTELKLQDLFKTSVNAVEAASQLITQYLKESPKKSMIKSGEMKQITPEMARGFVLTRTGITFIIGQYAISENGHDSFFIKIPYSDFGDKLDPQGPLKGLI